MAQKYADDQGGYLAVTITYDGFFAVFPLLLVLTTVLGFVRQGHRHLERRIVNSALGQFPVIGPQLNRGSLHGCAVALVLGLSAALSCSLMIEQPATPADERALTQRGKVGERRQDETVSIDFSEPEP